MKIVTSILLMICILVSIIYKIIDGIPNPIHWNDLIMFVFLIFLTSGDRITELIIDKTGFKIKENVNKQVSQVKKDVDAINAIESGNLDEINDLIFRNVNKNRDLWSKLVIYRLTMRSLLRKMCRLTGMTLHNTTAFVSMIKFLKNKSILNNELVFQIEFIRDVTFYFEWGTGTPPAEKSISDVLKLSPLVLKDLEKKIRQLISQSNK
ncbi:MAG: hypothetical protein H8E57_02280 [Candidatus Cloacimonetes bacterium]|nr:hypothetical protein [Candidatus Cloacimonadota bacterium]